MSILASFIALFTSVEAPMDPSVASEVSEASVKAAEVFEALAAQVPPMMVELPLSEADAPPNM